MEALILVVLTLSLIAAAGILSKLRRPDRPPLPPGPPTIPFLLKNVVFNKRSLFELEQILLGLHRSHGPVVSLRTLPRPTVFIQGRAAAHRALVHHGAALADRPPPTEPMLSLTCNRHDINTSPHGPLWRLLRRNLASETLARVKLFAAARRWAVEALIDELRDGEAGVVVRDKLRHAMFGLILAMCFGEKVEDEAAVELQALQYSLLRVFTRFNPFAVLPSITKLLFYKRWGEIVATRQRQAEIFAPLIRARMEEKRDMFLPFCYVDSLLAVEIPEEGGRRLREDEVVNMCHEFLSGATDTTSTALEWIMAELVRHPEMQKRLVDDIEEEDTERMPYLKAVVMEGLRRHPPGHFVLPHRAAEDVMVGGFLIPRGSEVHVNVAQAGWDAAAWEEPMEFRPERFMEGGGYVGKAVDLTGSGEIRMMPFGAGRRMCPGYGLATLHLEYFVANLVREFEWKAVDGEVVDMSEDFEFTTVMKSPLRARVIPRSIK